MTETADDKDGAGGSAPPVGEEPWELSWGNRSGVPDPDASEALRVDIEGFSGPLDLLLALARTHKLDLSRISILALTDQYLGYIAEAKSLNLEVAGDYLVMAAWLAFLKSKLLLPREKSDAPELSGDELAARLAFRLQRLQAMRDAAARLLTRKRLGIEVFARGAPETVRTVKDVTYTATIIDLLQAYGRQRVRAIRPVHVVRKRTVWSIKDARRRLELLVGKSAGDWVQLDLFMEQYLPSAAGNEEVSRTVLAASFGATLEMAREGMVEIRQAAAFSPIFLRRPPVAGATAAGEDKS